MSYRCAICRGVTPPRQAKLTHVVYRPDGNIAHELPVCVRCQRALADGVTLEEVRHRAKHELRRQAAAKAIPQTNNTEAKTDPQPTRPTFAVGQEL